MVCYSHHVVRSMACQWQKCGWRIANSGTGLETRSVQLSGSVLAHSPRSLRTPAELTAQRKSVSSQPPATETTAQTPTRLWTLPSQRRKTLFFSTAKKLCLGPQGGTIEAYVFQQVSLGVWERRDANPPHHLSDGESFQFPPCVHGHISCQLGHKEAAAPLRENISK